jgi:hypothetical protein
LQPIALPLSFGLRVGDNLGFFVSRVSIGFSLCYWVSFSCGEKEPNFVTSGIPIMRIIFDIFATSGIPS